MTHKIARSPNTSELVDFVSKGHAKGCLVTIHATCRVEFTGHRGGVVGSGDRVILCKRDGAVAVHRPTGARAVARQGIGSSFEVMPEGENVIIYASKDRNESIRINISEATLAIQHAALDDATLEENQTEEQMHEYIKSNPEDIEDGLRIIKHERPTPFGRVDFFAADSDGNNVILEIKQSPAEYSHVDQLQRYVSYFRESDSSQIRGILVAPYVDDRVKQILQKKGLEWIQMEEYQKTQFAPGQTFMSEWI